MSSITVAGNLNAAILTVTNSANSGAGTLRGLVSSATAGDTINFDSGISSITLTNGQINIGKSLTIADPGPASLKIDGDAYSRIFSIAPGSAAVFVFALMLWNNSISTY